MRTELRQALETVARRFRQVRFWGALAACWSVWGLIGLGLTFGLSRAEVGELDRRWTAAFAAAAVATGVVAGVFASRSARDRRWVARRIEERHPELSTGLVTAVEEDASSPGDLGYLQSTVIRKALEHRRRHDWEKTVPGWKLQGAKLFHAASLALLIVAFFNMAGQARSSRQSDAAIPGPRETSGLQVEPGNAEIERGTSLLVVARFDGAAPAEAELVAEDATAATRRAMTRSLHDPAFAGRIESVEADLAYRIEFGGRKSETYRVKVFEYPTVVRTDARLTFPGYTGAEPKTVEDVRHVTAVEGTELTFRFRLNKSVASANLVDEAGRTIPLIAETGDDSICVATFALAEPQRYRVELVDREGRANKVPTEIAVNVVRNRPATVAVARPAADVRVSPVEELTLGAKFGDDFGVVSHGLTYTLAGSEPKEVVLAGPAADPKKFEAGHLLDFESFAAEPDQLVSYHFWAEDIGPDGKPRRTFGDMFFAEVRPFEEIFRQGEQPAGGQQNQGRQQGGGAARQATQLAELQKEIINGTWTLIRRENGREPTEKFAEDARLLAESQKSAIAQAGELAAEMRDAASRSELDAAMKLMSGAAERLSRAAESAESVAIQPALAAEQAAYQALLKLRDREFNVVRGRQQNGTGGGEGGPSQAQLQQLELSNEENRYEDRRSAQSEAGSPEEQEERETRQVLNRLKELARRQQDLNERLKELRSALEAAEDEAAEEDLRRQLKRLREQEQQILQDADELRERMEREENRDRMAEARRQVEESRERVRQASEALEEGRVSQALTEGTRAGRELQELSDELRKESANRFSEEMIRMRDEARDLADGQDRLSDRLDALDDGSQRSLRDGGERQAVRQGLEGQKKRFSELLDRMRQTVQDAEEPEPMLAEKLFDALNEAERKAIPESLEAADRLTDFGIAGEAAKASRQVGEAFDGLQAGVEEAAESVLGDETETLRRAKGELEDLAGQIERELGRPPQDETAGGDGDRSDGRPEGEGPQAVGEGNRQDEGESSGQAEQPTSRDREMGPANGPQGRTQQGGGQDRQEPAGGDGQGRLGEVGEPSSQSGRKEPRADSGQEPNGRQPQAGGQAGETRGGGAEPRQLSSEMERLLDGGEGGPGPSGPITGDGFRQWSDRMRDVEEILDDPELRAEASRIRDRVRGTREAYRRDPQSLDPEALERLVARPLRELRERVAEELQRRESPDSLVPIDRDPVPPAYAEGVRRYYERLGSGR